MTVRVWSDRSSNAAVPGIDGIGRLPSGTIISSVWPDTPASSPDATGGGGGAKNTRTPPRLRVSRSNIPKSHQTLAYSTATGRSNTSPPFLFTLVIREIHPPNASPTPRIILPNLHILQIFRPSSMPSSTQPSPSVSDSSKPSLSRGASSGVAQMQKNAITCHVSRRELRW